jgi:hypothetical protein
MKAKAACAPATRVLDCLFLFLSYSAPFASRRSPLTLNQTFSKEYLYKSNEALPSASSPGEVFIEKELCGFFSR